MRRYASNSTIPSSALYAWQALGDSVYHKNPEGVHSLMLRRPALDRSQAVSNIGHLYIRKEFVMICIIDQF
jgi:hypothetical protein